jgi:hypothetical protein
MTRRLAGAAAIAAAAVVTGAALAAGAIAQPPAPGAQLQGTFQMTGTVTAARRVRGEHVGQVVHRTWTFTPQCPTAPCATVQLVRQRGAGADTLILEQTGPGSYAGAGQFSAPLKCAGRIYGAGEAIPFQIKVQITETGTTSAGTVATQISASYVNRSRQNLTPCVLVLGHDAARYTGQLASG